MKVGFALPNIGTPRLSKVGDRGRPAGGELGDDSLWTIERLLWPVKPQTPYPVTPNGSLSEPYQHGLLRRNEIVAGLLRSSAQGKNPADHRV